MSSRNLEKAGWARNLESTRISEKFCKKRSLRQKFGGKSGEPGEKFGPRDKNSGARTEIRDSELGRPGEKKRRPEEKKAAEGKFSLS